MSSFSGVKRTRAEMDAPKPLAQDVPPRWAKEIDDEHAFNAGRRLKKLRTDFMYEFQGMQNRMDTLEQRLKRLERNSEPIAEKVDEVSGNVLQESGTATPILELCDDEEPLVPRFLASLFSGYELPILELALIESGESYRGKLEREEKRIAYQVAEQTESVSLNCKSLAFEAELKDKALQRSENVVWDGKYFATLKGPRHLNEDRTVHFTFDYGKLTVRVFAVFDGHGGVQASEFCRSNLQATLLECWSALVVKGEDYEIANALKISCVRLDAAHRMHMLTHYARRPLPGTTACIALVIEDKLFVANCGDSRAVLCVSEEDAAQLTFDFKASDPYARQTVIKRGGEVVNTKGAMRVQGSLAITRAIGDEYLRKANGQKVISSRPKVMQVDLSQLKERERSFLLLMSDGISDFAQPKALARQAFRLRSEGKTDQEIAELLVTAAQKAGSKDDVTLGVCPVNFS
jgi:serine/threonine protein phosphatase PrpC